MLNRLFIIVGLMAILALAAAFIVPGFVQWGDYRDRMQAIASETFGAPVTITGDIKFSLLPQPQLNFSMVVVGSADRPIMTVEQVEAQFSLIDFIRDRYALTRLVLQKPVIDLTIDADGKLEAAVSLAEQVSQSNVSVANALITDGTVRLADVRSGQILKAGNIDGELRIDAVRGPFGFQGTAEAGGEAYDLRLATGTVGADHAASLNLFARPRSERFSLAAEGTLRIAELSFSGTATYRQEPIKPVEGRVVDAGAGALVIASKVEANADRILLSDYTVVPDENRAATRLLGAAEIKLGKAPRFNAVISGTSLALPPRDATAENLVAPYELVRLLGELPLPPHTALPGTVGIDVADVNLRAVSLRNVRLDAESVEDGWQVKALTAQLPGATVLNLSGRLTTVAGRPNFAGTVRLSTQRLDQFAQLWRKPGEGRSPLAIPGALRADVALVGETLSLRNALLSLDGTEHSVAAEIGFGSNRHLNLTAQFGQLSGPDSEALSALWPNMTDGGAFGLTFPSGKFSVSAQGAQVFGLDGIGLVADGGWDGGVVVADRVAAESLGGAQFDAKLTGFGSFEKPEVSGSATMNVLAADAPALDRLFDALNMPGAARDLLRRSMPADLAFRLDAPGGEGGQTLAASGRVSTADLALDAKLGAGFLRALSGPLSFTLDLRSGDAVAMTEQLGLGSLSLTPEGEPVHVVAVVEGTPSNSLETTLRVEGGGDSIGFSGNVVVSDPERLTGNGTIKLALSDFSALTESLGAGGIDIPAVAGSAHLEFIGTSSLQLDDIAATSGGDAISGSLSLSDTGPNRTVSGTLALGSIDLRGLLTLLVGRQSLLSDSAVVWPIGPFATGQAARTTTGRVAVTAPVVSTNGQSLATGATFDLDWDADSIHVRDFSAALGGGQLSFELGVCCAGPLPDKQFSGRLALEDVALDAMLPERSANALEGRIDGSARFESTAGDLQSVFAALTGEGSYTLRDFRIERFDPQTFAAAAALDKVLDTDASVLTASLTGRLDDAPFVTSPVRGSFTVAGGTIRSPNLVLDGDSARLFGSISMSLRDLGLGGGFVMSPRALSDPDGLISEATARIVANLGGTILDPDWTFDTAGMIDAMKARALEIEVERLEKLRSEDEARQKAAAEERARVTAEEAAKKAAADAAARKAAEEAARQDAEEAAADEAAKRKAEEDAWQRQPLQLQPTDFSGPFDLGIN